MTCVPGIARETADESEERDPEQVQVGLIREKALGELVTESALTTTSANKMTGTAYVAVEVTGRIFILVIGHGTTRDLLSSLV